MRRRTSILIVTGAVLAVALVGFAGAANASATIDLIWADTGTNEITNVNSSSAITLQVILTAGPNGSSGAVVSVDYSAALGTLTVLGAAVTLSAALPLAFTGPIDTGSRIEGINARALLPFIGTGLFEGQSAQIGTVTFHRAPAIPGVFEIRSDANSPSDAVFDIDGNVITATTTFNSAVISDVHPPPCPFLIEINMLRGGSPTVTVNTPKKITAKARIQKGTAARDTTIDTTLRIDAVDGTQLIDSQFSGPIQLEVGKGGQGDTLTMNIKQCDSGSIDFDVRFFGTDVNGVLCATRRITKTCK